MTISSKSQTIAHLVESFLPLTENWIYNQIIKMRRYRPIVLTYQRIQGSDFPFEPVYSWKDEFGAAKRFVQRVEKKVLNLDYLPFFSRVLKREQARLIHAHFGNLGATLVGLKIKTGLPLVTTFYGYDAGDVPNRPGWMEKYQRLFAEGDLFLAEGSHLKRTLVDLGCPSEKVIVQHLGVDLEKINFRPIAGSDDENVRVLISASFVEKKGIPCALRALAKVKTKYKLIEITIIGDGVMRPEIERLIVDLNLTEIKMLGYQPYERFLAELAKSDVFLHPSVTAANGDTEGGAPVSLIEAQAVGVPVIATKHADIPEVVKDSETGLLADEKDVDGLAVRLEYLIDHPEIRSAMGKAGRAHVTNEYNLLTQVDKLEYIYASIN